MARAESSFADLRSAQRFALEIGALDEAFGLIGSIREFAMRAMRYEVFALGRRRLPRARRARSSARAAADRHAGVRRVGPRRVRARDRRSPRRPASSRTRSAWRRAGLPNACSPTCSTSSTEATSGNVEAARQVELAEASGNESRLCTRATWVRSRSAPKADTTRPTTRRASARACAGDRAAQPTWRRPRSPKASRAGPRPMRSKRSSTADRIARAAGNRWMSAFAAHRGERTARRPGRVEEGCAGLAEMVALWYRAGDWSQQWHTLSRCVIALAPDRKPRAGDGARRRDRDARHARRRADDVDPARRRVRNARRVDRPSSAPNEPPSSGPRAPRARSRTSCSARGRRCSPVSDCRSRARRR